MFPIISTSLNTKTTQKPQYDKPNKNCTQVKRTALVTIAQRDSTTAAAQ
jgi:hypothetical protein